MEIVATDIVPPPSPNDAHLANVAENLQLVADLGYGDVSLLVLEGGGLRVRADAKPMTAVAAVAASRVGLVLPLGEEPEAREALASGRTVCGSKRRTTRGIAYVATAYPLGEPAYGVIVRHLAQQVAEAPGKMERAFIDVAEQVLERLREGPITDLDTGASYTTGRRAGDGVLRVGADGHIAYASPNAVNIMRLAGVETALEGESASALPGGATSIAPVVGTRCARTMTVDVASRALYYRTIDLDQGALVLVEDVTEARRAEQELRVKEATIREVHHRVKNNLQTIASLLRIQARRTKSDEVKHSLAEAIERVSSMAVVHEMLAGSADESVDLAAAVRSVVDMVRQGLAGDTSGIVVIIDGETGAVPAAVGTSLALVTAELVHNAIEHGVGPGGRGTVVVSMRRLSGEVHLVVRDDGRGVPEGFSAESTSNLGLAIVKTLVEDDLRGTLHFGGGRGTAVTIRVPIVEQEQ